MTYTRGFTNGAPPVVVKPITSRHHNVFKAGQPVVVKLKGTGATSYRVLDYEGNVVESGPLTNTVSGTTLALGISVVGSYRLLLDGANDQGGQWGTSVGDTNITIVRATSPLPDFPPRHFQRLVVSRIDPRLIFYWQSVGPDPLTGKTDFSARWNGFVQCPTSEVVTLTLSGGEGVRLWVGAVGANDTPVIDSWDGTGSRVGTFQFTANQRVPVRAEYWNGWGNSFLEWTWQGLALGSQQVPASALFQAASGATPGLQANYYTDRDFVTRVSTVGDDGNADAVVNEAFGLGGERWVAKTSDPAESIARITHNIAIETAMRQGHEDAARPRYHLVAFPNGTTDTQAVTQIVTELADVVTHWESQNEPQDAYQNAAVYYNTIFKPFRDLVKSIAPNAKVIGPACVSVGPILIRWNDEFLAACPPGGMDGFSFHVYNDILGDANHARQHLHPLLDSLKKHGHEGVELWQTEQGADVSYLGVYHPRHQCEWVMRQKMLFEQFGLPKERDPLWYTVDNGHTDYCQWSENTDGSLNPVALAMRVYSEEVWGTQFKRALDFGAPGNDLMLGNLFENPIGLPFKRVVMLQNNGAVQSSTQTSPLNANLVFSTNQSVKIVNTWGVESTATPINGLLSVPVGEVPLYIQVNAGQNVGVSPTDWGQNCAALAGVVVTSNHAGTYLEGDPPAAGQSDTRVSIGNSIEKIINGYMESWYHLRTVYSHPWIAVSPGNVGLETPTIDSNGNLLTPTVVELDLARDVTAQQVVIYACTPWQRQGTIRAGTVEGWVNGAWQLLGTITQATKKIYASSTLQRSKLETYFENDAVFVIPASGLVLSKVRLTVSAVTKGGAPDAEIASAGMHDGYNRLTLRAIEVWGNPLVPLPATGLSARFWPPTESLDAMKNGKFQGSNDGVTYTDLATIATRPPQNQWTTIALGTTNYRFLRYLAPSTNGGRGPAEIEYWNNNQRLKGKFVGSAGSYNNFVTRVAGAAMDGSTETFYDTVAGPAFVGIDTQSPPLSQPRIAAVAPVTPPPPPDTTAPGVPPNLQALVVGQNRIDLSWDSSSDNVGVDHYAIQQNGVLLSAQPTATGHIVMGLVAGSAHAFRVAAVDAAGNASAWSALVSATTQNAPPVVDTTAPSVPTGLQAVVVGQNRIDLSWQASADDIGVHHYEIERDGVIL